MTDYQRDGDAMTQTYGDLVFRATALRDGLGGQKKAGVTITLKGAPLWSHDFTLANGKDQQWLSNAAHRQADGQLAQSKEELAHLMMLFCVGLADAYAGDQVAVLTRGSAEPRTPPWLIEDVVLRKGGTILFAPPGQGKSYIALLLAQSLNYGRGELWETHYESGDNALYLNLERGQESLEDRLGNVNAALGLPRDAGMLMIHGRGKTLEKVMDGARRTIQEHGTSLVVLDSLSRAGVGDLSSNEAANRAMDLLNGLGVGWLCLAHTPREDESHTYGSVQFDAAADLTIRMYSELNNVDPAVSSLGIVLKIIKTNDTGHGKTRLVVLDFSEHGLHAAYHGSELGFPKLMEKVRS